ncbi:VOC family protein [Blastochloris viridis]|uniref:VOC family protein n=1 Tax=Blastochloris viridis TaxID=1079 RepID=UPI001F21223B|nr:VOC family protein [Blastochloris viridis]
MTDAAAAMTFYRNVFDAVERRCLPGRAGGVAHAELTINRGLIVLSDTESEAETTAPPLPGEGASVSLRLMLPSIELVDAWYARAVSNGAAPEMAPTNAYWGLRFAAVRDPFGHRWILQARNEAR